MMASRRPKLLLLDAGAIFIAHHLRVWQALSKVYELLVPSIIIHDEARFYPSQNNQNLPLDLSRMVKSGEIREVSCSASELYAFMTKVPQDYQERMDAGEKEALAYMLKERDPGLRLVTGDGAAIEVAVLVDDDARVTCLEDVLSQIGLTKPFRGGLLRPHSKLFFDERRAKGMERKIWDFEG